MCSSIILNQNVDPGRDGASTSLSGQPNNPNEVFANDVIAFALHYYDQFDYEDENGNLVTTNDYSPIGGGGLTPLISVLPAANITNSDVAANSNDLFNGNIRAMQTTLSNPTTHAAMPMANAYKYDQLNRLLSSKSFVNLTGNQWGNTGTYDNRYLNTFEYDAMGNIVHQNRYTEAGVQIEDMSYGYKKDASGNLLRNRLYNINDFVDSLVDDSDIDDMDDNQALDLFNPQNQNIESDYNYAYDEEGRLIRDDQEKIGEIIWRVDGKVKEIRRPSGSGKKNISFDYDAMGNRIAKNVFDDDWNLISSTYYILDAQGNQINVYEHEVDSNNVLYTLKERHIYGSSSLGIKNDSIGMYYSSNDQNLNTELGLKSYSLSNHLGNVLTVISDVKIPQSTDGINVSGSWVGIRNISDYSPFGVLLAERTIESTFFRTSFQGQAYDDEVKGEGNSVNFKYRMHDPRVGRFFAVDPLSKKYPWNSTYAFSENDVITHIELEGLEKAQPLYLSGSDKPNPNAGKPDFKSIEPKPQMLPGGPGLMPTENALLAPKSAPKQETNTNLSKMDEVVEIANTALGEADKRLGAAFEHAVIDNTGKIHFQTKSGKTFGGNQYRTVESLSTNGKTLNRLSNAHAVIGLYYDVIEVSEGYKEDGYKIGENTITQGAGIAGSAGGAWGGAMAGAEFGSFAGPWGTVIGGVVGGIGGAIFGESAAELGAEMYFQGNNQGGVSIDLNWKLFESGKDNTRLNCGPTY